MFSKENNFRYFDNLMKIKSEIPGPEKYNG